MSKELEERLLRNAKALYQAFAAFTGLGKNLIAGACSNEEEAAAELKAQRERIEKLKSAEFHYEAAVKVLDCHFSSKPLSEHIRELLDRAEETAAELKAGRERIEAMEGEAIHWDMHSKAVEVRAEMAEAARDKALADVEMLRKALQQFAIHGIPRIDHTPTRIFFPDNEKAMAAEEWWQSYFTRGNQNVKDDAQAALKETSGEQDG